MTGRLELVVDNAGDDVVWSLKYGDRVMAQGRAASQTLAVLRAAAALVEEIGL